MKAFKHSGLVRILVKQPFRNYHAGDTVLFSPSEAQKWIDAGHAEEAKLPKGVEAVAVPDPRPDLMSGKILPQEMPAIPEDWEEHHYLQRTKLAEQVAGRPVKREEVDEVIKAELARRLTE